MAVLGTVVDYYRNLKPVDLWCLVYLIITFPLCFVAPSLDRLVWSGILVRFILIPGVVYFRAYFQRIHYPRATINCFWKGFAWAGRKETSSYTLDLGHLYWLLDWYVAFVFIYLYAETGQLIGNLYGPNFSYDLQVREAEVLLFSEQLSVELRNIFPGKALGEYLHFCYFSFYFLIISLGAGVYLQRPREFWDKGASGLSLCFFSCFAFYLLYPVKGPFHVFPRPDPDDVGYLFSHIVHWLLKAESSEGTATPSSHCAISVVVWFMACLYHRPLAIGFIFLVPGLVVATVWCGFHYAFDAVIGCVWGILAGTLGVMLANSMTVRRPAYDTHYSLEKFTLPFTTAESAQIDDQPSSLKADIFNGVHRRAPSNDLVAAV